MFKRLIRSRRVGKLPLKKDALKKLNLPVEVKSGFIGKLKIEIPFRRLKSQPWVVQMDQLYLIAGPSVAPPVSVSVCMWILHIFIRNAKLFHVLYRRVWVIYIPTYYGKVLCNFVDLCIGNHHGF